MARRSEQAFRRRSIQCGCERTVTRIPKQFTQDENRSPGGVCGSFMDRLSSPPSPAL